MSYFSSLPDEAAVPDILKQKPEVGVKVIELNEAIMRGPSPLSAEERELIAAYVSGLNACNYCFGVHAETAHALGVSEGMFEKLLDDPSAAPVGDKMKPMLAYMKKLTEAPATLSQKDADAVFEAGWSEEALHDAILSAALFNFMNRLLEGHGVKGSDALFKSRGPMLAEHGYAGLISVIAGATE